MKIKRIRLHTTKDSKPFSWKIALLIGIALLAMIIAGLVIKHYKSGQVFAQEPTSVAAINANTHVDAAGVGVVQDRTTPTPKAPVVKQEATPTHKPTSVEEIIGSVFGDKKDEAVKVAFCESSLNPNCSHKTSSAKGLFQIVKGTWKQFKCEGDQLDALDNTICAKKIYDYYGSWNTKGGWAASELCHLLD
jgi:hypothetical protein